MIPTRSWQPFVPNHERLFESKKLLFAVLFLIVHNQTVILPDMVLQFSKAMLSAIWIEVT